MIRCSGATPSNSSENSVHECYLDCLAYFPRFQVPRLLSLLGGDVYYYCTFEELSSNHMISICYIRTAFHQTKYNCIAFSVQRLIAVEKKGLLN